MRNAQMTIAEPPSSFVIRHSSFARLFSRAIMQNTRNTLLFFALSLLILMTWLWVQQKIWPPVERPKQEPAAAKPLQEPLPAVAAEKIAPKRAPPKEEPVAEAPPAPRR